MASSSLLPAPPPHLTNQQQRVSGGGDATIPRKPGTLLDLRRAWENGTLEHAEVRKEGLSSLLVLQDGTTFEFNEKQVLVVDEQEKEYAWGSLWHLLKYGSDTEGKPFETRTYLSHAMANKLKNVPIADRLKVIQAIKLWGEGQVQIRQPGVWGNWPSRGIMKDDTAMEVGRAEFLERVMKKEVTYSDRNAILKTTRGLTAVQEIDSKSKEMEEVAKKMQNRSHKTKSMGQPIIIVPPDADSTLNLYNIKQFLIENRYVSGKECRDRGDVKPVDLVITRNHPRVGAISYVIKESTVGFKDEDWARTIAVFVSGQPWQFKTWKWPEPAEIFQHCRGIYVYFDDNKLPDQVRVWNVALMPLKHDSRHRDAFQAKSVWEAIDKHVDISPFHQVLINNLVEQAEQRARREREENLKRLRMHEEEEGGAAGLGDM